MNTHNKQKLVLILIGIVAFFAILGMAGRDDYDEYVILHMSMETYERIYADLSSDGDTPSDHDIVVEYNKHYRHAENN